MNNYIYTIIKGGVPGHYLASLPASLLPAPPQKEIQVVYVQGPPPTQQVVYAQVPTSVTEPEVVTPTAT